MRRTFAILCFLAGITAVSLPVRAQDLDTAAKDYTGAFLSSRKADELEQVGDFKNALKLQRAVAETLSRIKRQWPTWQPEILDYRMKLTTEAVNRLHQKVGAAPGAEPEPGDGPADILPPPDELVDSARVPEVVRKDRGKDKGKKPGFRNNPANLGPLDAVKEQISQLETQIQDTNEKLSAEHEKNAALTKELTEAVETRQKAEAERKKAADLWNHAQKNLAELIAKGDADALKLKDLEKQLALAKTKNSTTEAELAAAEERISQLIARSRALAQGAAQAGVLPAKIKQLETKLAEEQAAKKELTEKLTTAVQERDEARNEIVRLKDANKQTDKLMAENASLLKKLGDAEKQILTFKEEGPKKDEQIALLQKQVTETQRALAATQEKNATLQTEVGNLQKQVADYTKQVQQFKTDKTASAEDKKRMEEENRLLQGIVMRVLQEDANRAQRKKMVQKEMDRLQIQSDVMLKQIDYLTQPVVKLRPEERRLFKKPILEVQDPNTIIAIKTETPTTPATASAPAENGAASTAAPNPSANPADKPTAANAEPLPGAQPEKTPGTEPKPGDVAKLETKPDSLPPVDPAAGPADPASTPPKPLTAEAASKALPEDVKPFAEQAKQAFEREKYTDAEKLYDKALALAPKNLYLLSNKGVVQFRAQKYKQAEESFRKALAIAPEDAFCWCTLGIVQYSQSKYDDAVSALTKSLAINAKNPTAHNYLGITAAQKGWLEAAQKELETAIQLDPKYADAYFNLAVTHTLRQPPNKEEARKAYKKAVELGAEADPTMEESLK